MAPSESEIFVSRADRDDVNLVKQISNMGPGDIRYNADQPDLAYNSDRNEVMVVWRGDRDAAFTGDGDFAIYAQRLNAALNEIGEDDKRVEFLTGPSGNPGSSDYVAGLPAITYHPDEKEYVVVYEGTDFEDGAPVDGLFATRLGGTGSVLSPFTSYLIHASPSRTGFDIAAADGGDGYLVCWSNNGVICGRHLSAATAQPVGSPSKRC